MVVEITRGRDYKKEAEEIKSLLHEALANEIKRAKTIPLSQPVSSRDTLTQADFERDAELELAKMRSRSQRPFSDNELI